MPLRSVTPAIMPGRNGALQGPKPLPDGTLGVGALSVLALDHEVRAADGAGRPRTIRRPQALSLIVPPTGATTWSANIEFILVVWIFAMRSRMSARSSRFRNVVADCQGQCARNRDLAFSRSSYYLMLWSALE